MRVHPHTGKYLAIAGTLLLGWGFATPAQAESVTSCPAGSSLVAKFEFTGGGYVFTEPAGNKDIVQITEITDVDPADGAAWESTVAIGYIVVKGGSAEPPDGVSVITHTLVPPAYEGTFSNEGLLNDGDNVPDISHVLFCGPITQETTTTTAATSTTAESTTSTTAPGETTTTTAQVQGTQVTQATPTTAVTTGATTAATTEVLGVQLARTGFSATMLVLGISLLVLGLVVELLQRAALRKAELS